MGEKEVKDSSSRSTEKKKGEPISSKIETLLRELGNVKHQVVDYFVFT